MARFMLLQGFEIVQIFYQNLNFVAIQSILRAKHRHSTISELTIRQIIAKLGNDFTVYTCESIPLRRIGRSKEIWELFKQMLQ